LYAGTGGRKTAQGYTSSDNLRQKFTSKERDNETGLDYFLARYYSSTQGRFTGSDPLLSSATLYDPQSWNRYSYTLNNPLKYTDPFGMYICDGDKSQCQKFESGLTRAQEALKKLDSKSDQYQKLQRALNAYGAKGVNNGVTVKFDSTQDGAPAHTNIGISSDSTGMKISTDDNPSGQNTVVTIDLKQNENLDKLAGNIAHEGSHVADGTLLVRLLPGSLASPFASAIHGTPMNPTNYQTEVRAFGVSSAVSQGLGHGNLKVGPKYGN